jgi:hypothetical protein
MKKIILAAALATLVTAPMANAQQEGVVLGGTTGLVVGGIVGLIVLGALLDDSSTTTTSTGP